MLERLVAWVLNTYIGEYVENLNTYQLTVGLFQGQVELENLPLKRDALKKLDLPIEVKSGFIGKVQLKVPLTRLKSEQWVITLDKLYLVAGPLSASNLQSDGNALKQIRQDAKKAQLKALEENWLIQKNLIDRSLPHNKTYSWLSYGTSLVTNIVENLVLQINDIHVRYEDDVTIPGCPFSCGLTIDSISAQSADFNWLPRFVSCSDGATMNKILDIRGLSIYWDANSSMAGMCSPDQLTDFFQKMFTDKNSGASGGLVHDYILEPVSAQAKLSRHRSSIPLRSVEQPRFCVELSLDALPLQLSDFQFRGMVAIGAEVKRHSLRQRFMQWRPNCAVLGNARTWWKFAIEAHVYHINKRNRQSRWTFLLSRARENVRYVAAYRNYLIGGSRNLSGLQKESIDVPEENLTFDELRVLREVVYDQMLNEHRQVVVDRLSNLPGVEEIAQSDDNSQRGWSWLQSWFPDWSGWYGSPQQSVDDIQQGENVSMVSSATEAIIDEKQIEQDIFDALCDSVDSSSLLYQDVVFARLTLCIKNGSFSLRKSGLEGGTDVNSEAAHPPGSCLLELECSSITTSFESRPRFNSLKFALFIEDFYLRDKVTTNSTMPVLIQPMNKEMLSQSISPALGVDQGQLFKLIYESKPFRTKADYRLVIDVKPLNIIYSPIIIQQLKDLFAFSKIGGNCDIELDIAAAAARNQFENLKKHTQNEVKQTLDDLLEGRSETKGNRWLFDLDICAPYIMIPENLTDTNSGVVVVDLGHLKFCNLQTQALEVSAKPKEPSESDDDDDLFMTPMSTPPPEQEQESGVDEDKSTLCLESISSTVSPSSVFDRFYEKYMLSFCDLQVMVGKVKDNWKVAHIKGTSLLHVVDKFSISLQLERRMIRTYNSRCPKVRLSGNVPSIIIHISEQKMSSLLKCIQILSSSSADLTKRNNSHREQFHRTRRHIGAAELLSRSRLSLKSVDCRTIEQTESVLLSANFGVDHLSLEIQSRGRSIAELQVTNVLATCVQKQFKTSISFVLHSLLIVDALQTLGPDYELLVASHGRICLDRQSGIIRDSGPNSPDRVSSPSCPMEKSPANTPSAPFDISCSLSYSAMLDSKHRQSVLPLTDNEKALIKLNVDFIDLGDSFSSDESLLCQANVDFDSLDVVANQQTLAELVGFFASIMPMAGGYANSPVKHESNRTFMQDSSLPASKVRKDVLANFHSLNVLLMRVEKKHSSARPRARRVAVVTLCDAKIQTSLSNEFSAEASLSGLQVLDLTPEGNKYHQRVIYVGNLPTYLPTDKSCERKFCASDRSNEALSDAFRLRLDRHLEHSLPVINVFLRVASVRYMHVPSLLTELSMCLIDFHDFFKRLTTSLSNTATELAMGLVVPKPADKLSGSLWHVDNLGTSRHDSFVHSEQFLFSPSEHNEECGDDDGLADDYREASIDSDAVIHLDVVFESPIIMLPRTLNSSDVLLLHLGKIVVYNVALMDEGETLDSFDTVVMQIHDASMSSINLEEQDPFSDTYHDAAGIAILHSTSIELKIKKNWQGNSVPLHECFAEAAEQAAFLQPDLNRLLIAGEVLTSVRFVLTKQVFEQILKTLDNITPSDEQQPNLNLQPQSENHLIAQPSLETAADLRDFTTRSRHVSEKRQAPALVVAGSFVLPSLNIKMVADLADGIVDRGLVNLQLDSFTVYIIARQGVKALDVRLQSLVLEDLLIDPSASHRWLMVSRGSSGYSSSKPHPIGIPAVYISQSLPTGTAETMCTGLPSSLPSSLSHGVDKEFFLAGNSVRRHEKGTAVHQDGNGSAESIGKSSSESLDRENDQDLLVHVKVKLIDRKAPEYVSYYNKTNRFVSVIFNSLETTVNLETWVLLLEFLGISGKNHNPENFTRAAQQKMLACPMVEEEIINTNISVDVARLSLVLNKPEYELASAEVTSVVARISARDCNLDVSGQLGSLMLRDTSPYGNIYRERLYTPCERSIDFSIFKYGLPDPDSMREYDVRVKLHIPPMWYVHTHRFMQEIIAYFQNFNQLQDIIGRSRAASDGRTIADRAYHNARVSLDIAASEPMILIPHSSRTKDILVLNLGKLRVQNAFLRDGSEGTLSEMLTRTEARVDVAEINTMTQSVYGSLDSDWRSSPLGDELSRIKSTEPERLQSSVVLSSFYSALGTDCLSSVASSIIQSQAPPFLETNASFSNSLQSYSFVDANYRCLLDVMNIELIDTELYSAKLWHLYDTEAKRSNSDLLFPSFVVRREQGDILKEKCRLQLQVERNLDVDIVRSVPDLSIDGKLSSVHLFIDTLQYKLIRGVLSHNFGEKLEDFQNQLMSNLKDPNTQSVLSGQATKSLSIGLELDGVKVELLLAHSGTCGKRDMPLAQFDFQRSVLKFESRSDNSKDIDLVSHEILISDTRFRDEPVNVRPNVFTDILKPSADRRDPTALQLELHCRCSGDVDRYKVILNNMRLVSVFDWLLVTIEFLASSFEDPFQKDREAAEDLALAKSSSSSWYAVNSGSILTKRVMASERKETAFELCLNLTESELVVVESPGNWDTNAVILKGTAIVSYCPRSDRILSCSLSSLELFSCSLAAENETALSIIDPMSLSIELNNSNPAHNRRQLLGTPTVGLLDVATANDHKPVMEISFQTLYIRLSYNDICLFLAIINSVPHQLINARHVAPPKNSSSGSQQLSELERMGFPLSDCELALCQANGDLGQAVGWLTKNASSVIKKKAEHHYQLCGFEVKCGSVSVCLIDDCQDTDVPLAELMLTDFYVLHKLYPKKEGSCRFEVTGDYYNRLLSGWEPFIEKWNCQVSWNETELEFGRKLIVQVLGGDSLLNFNLTSCFLDLVKNTQSKWVAEYNKTQMSSSAGKYSSVMYNSRRRVPFIPFALKNNTGCRVKFLAMSKTLATASRLSERRRKQSDSEWKVVEPNTELPFLIDEYDKLRHKHSSEVKVHQIFVKVDGWKEVLPVSVDKVGVYFRQADADIDNSSKLFQEMPPVRLLFEIDIDSTARKMITIRSGVLLNNQLNDAVEVKLVNSNSSVDREFRFFIEPASQMPLPLKFVYANIWLRPVNWSLDWSKKPMTWQSAMYSGDVVYTENSCSMLGGEPDSYRFCVSAQNLSISNEPFVSQRSWLLPGHLITIAAPFHIESLLPIDMNYTLLVSGNTTLTGTVKSGKRTSMVVIDINQSIEFQVSLENFPQCRSLVIPPGTTDFATKMCLHDSENRPLELTVSIKNGLAGSIHLTVAASFWLVNRSGLPLIFKQDGCALAAGQFAEHEIARSVTPLLFCFAEKEKYELLTMKLGKSVHGPQTYPQWCQRFMLERGIAVRQVHVSTNESRPDWVYNLGIEVRQGRGRYSETSIVMIKPRYQLVNHSSHKLAYAQRHATLKQGENFLSAPTNSELSYHWPRVDLDNLLCVRLMDKQTCNWSGGFLIDKVDSFHINMRSEGNQCLFLRVDIALQGATFVIEFTDTDQMPPPYRIDNFAEISVLFHQTKISTDRLRTWIKPRTSLPYAWDEPTGLPHITLKVASGTDAVYDMNTIGDGEKLYYENFIYIAFSHTFQSSSLPALSPLMMGYRSYFESQELVLDVIDGRVMMKRKELGRRSQLWRMSSGGMLQHEGSSSPRDPRSRISSSADSLSSCFVLDIDDIALQPNRAVPLTLRKIDERRKSTQKWKFTQGGLFLGETNLCIQVKDGVFGLHDGGEVVLGPASPQGSSRNLVETTPETAVERQKSHAGSGVLCVKVINDGPTRVLQITDIQLEQYRGTLVDDWMVIDSARKPELNPKAEPAGSPEFKQDIKPFAFDFELFVRLPKGIGLSLIDNTPEELIYVTFRGVTLEYININDEHIVHCDVHSFQVDNQLLDSCRPVLLCVLPATPQEDNTKTLMPALTVSLHKLPSRRWNAHIFKDLSVLMKPVTLQIEEKLLWKLLLFCGFQSSNSELGNCEEVFVGSHRISPSTTSGFSRRHYFGMIKINLNYISLSMLTSVNLPSDLKLVKRSFGIPLIRFEDAKVELDPFLKLHLFETTDFLAESIQLHYTGELMSQAAKILGSVDFLGNPLGLFSDMAEGVSGLLEGNVGGLLKNFTHGVTNSAAKVVGTLSDSVGMITLDKQHQRQRLQIMNSPNDGGRVDPLRAGFNSLLHGVYGGFKSIPQQTYQGACDDGIVGLVSGFGKGLIGTVTKPVAGFLDLTSSAASTIRDTSKGQQHRRPARYRRPRCCYGNGGLLPPYQDSDAEAQEILLQRNNLDFSEKLLTVKLLCSANDYMIRLLISSRTLYFVNRNYDDDVLRVSLDKLLDCQSVCRNGMHYVALTVKGNLDSMAASSADVPRKRPEVRCDSQSIAESVTQHIIYAKSMFDEMKLTLRTSADSQH